MKSQKKYRSRRRSKSLPSTAIESNCIHIDEKHEPQISTEQISSHEHEVKPAPKKAATTMKVIPNFFIAFRLNSILFQQRVALIQQGIIERNPSLTKCMTPVEKLHFTGFVMRLTTDDEVSRAIDVMRDSQKDIEELIIAFHQQQQSAEANDVTIQFGQLGVFGKNVLFVEPVHHDAENESLILLQQINDHIHTAFLHSDYDLQHCVNYKDEANAMRHKFNIELLQQQKKKSGSVDKEVDDDDLVQRKGDDLKENTMGPSSITEAALSDQENQLKESASSTIIKDSQHRDMNLGIDHEKAIAVKMSSTAESAQESFVTNDIKVNDITKSKRWMKEKKRRSELSRETNLSSIESTDDVNTKTVSMQCTETPVLRPTQHSSVTWHPHATVAKTSADRRNGRKLSFKSSDYDDLQTHVENLTVPVLAVELLSMQEVEDSTGYYRSYYSIPVSHGTFDGGTKG